MRDGRAEAADDRGGGMVRRLLVGFQAVALALMVAVALPAGSAHADVSDTPVATGCAAGFDHLSVASLEAQGYAPDIFDLNNNGFVCGLPLPDGFHQQLCGSLCSVPVSYMFRDDDNPAQVHAG